MVRMKDDGFEAGLVVDIKAIVGMGDIVETDDAFIIGAAVPCAALTEHAGLVAAWPGGGEAEAAAPGGVTREASPEGRRSERLL